MLKAGSLNRQICIQRRVSTKDAYGQESATWEDVFTCYASVLPLRGTERLAAMSLQTNITHTVAVRYQSGMMPPSAAVAMRIYYATVEGDRFFNIIAARDVDEAHHTVIYDCVEGSRDGS